MMWKIQNSPSSPGQFCQFCTADREIFFFLILQNIYSFSKNNQHVSENLRGKSFIEAVRTSGSTVRVHPWWRVQTQQLGALRLARFFFLLLLFCVCILSLLSLASQHTVYERTKQLHIWNCQDHTFVNRDFIPPEILRSAQPTGGRTLSRKSEEREPASEQR